jgi:hypothetical protein
MKSHTEVLPFRNAIPQPPLAPASRSAPFGVLNRYCAVPFDPGFQAIPLAVLQKLYQLPMEIGRR